jgi:hypothetical protein
MLLASVSSAAPTAHPAESDSLDGLATASPRLLAMSVRPVLLLKLAPVLF